jgi:tetratricopeptide (TPR) repeat protein
MKSRTCLLALTFLIAAASAASPATAQSLGSGVCKSSPAECEKAFGGGKPTEGTGGVDFIPQVDPANAAFKRGSAALDAGDLRAAEAAFAEVLRINGSHGPALNELGRVYLRQRRYAEARDKFEKSAALGIQAARKNLQEVDEYLRKVEAVAQANKKAAQDWVDYGITAFKAMKYPQARQAFVTARKIDPNNEHVIAAEGYLRALERKQALGNSPWQKEEARRRAEEEARRRADAGNPSWIAETLDTVAKKLRRRDLFNGSVALSEAEWAAGSGAAGSASGADDLASAFTRDFFDTERNKRPKGIESSLPDLEGEEIQQKPLESVAPLAHPKADPLPPVLQKAEAGRTLNADDLAALERAREAARRRAQAAAQSPPSVSPPAPAQADCDVEQVEQIEIEMVTSAPSAPRRPRFKEPPAPGSRCSKGG